MFDVLRHRAYRHLFAAQVVALTGTGLATVALGLLAYDLAGPRAGMVLGIALTIKMLAYVFLSPLAAALTEAMDRRRVLVALDLVRAVAAACLPLVTEIWQVYVLIFVLQAASAGFTPAFQATIPTLLPDEEDYTKALSLSRLTYDLESLVSPALAALLLGLVSFNALFLGTALGFVGSALLVVSVALPRPGASRTGGLATRSLRGLRLYLATPRLRGLLALNLAVAMPGAMVLVNTVVLVKSELDGSDRMVALALGAFGGGSMLAALALPRLLDRFSDRLVMLAGGVAMAVTGLGLALWVALLGLTSGPLLLAWFLNGVGFASALTPSGRLLRRSAGPEDLPALFAAQFSLSHACWLLAYPLAGWLATVTTPQIALTVLALIGAAGCLAAARLWSPAVPPEPQA
ncbi:MFS transporter [Ruegeria pomeroyi]|nr:MFS transporter [Ruegeria pomeroyi]MCE8555403.1 MFS transporter [Ruegeria pomeroyi]